MKYVDTDPGKPQKPQVIDRRRDTDDAEMLANDAYQQTMYETSDQEESDNKPYAAPEKGEPNTQKRLCHNVRTSINVPDVEVMSNVQDVIVPDVQDMPDVRDVPKTTAHNIFNTKGHQTNSWQEFAAAATLATYDVEFAAATLATYDEEFATAATYDEEFATANLATYDEEFAANTTPERGSLGGITKCAPRA